MHNLLSTEGLTSERRCVKQSVSQQRVLSCRGSFLMFIIHDLGAICIHHVFHCTTYGKNYIIVVSFNKIISICSVIYKKKKKKQCASSPAHQTPVCRMVGGGQPQAND